MPVKKPDNVGQYTTSTGTGDLSFDGVAIQNGDGKTRTVAQAIADGDIAWGDTGYYVVQDSGGREWGVAAIAGPTSPRLVRSAATGVRSSLGVGVKISAAGAGVTQIFFAVPDYEKLLTQDRKANGGTIAETGTDNAFTVKQTMGAGLDVTGATVLTGDLTASGDAAINGGNLTLTKTDDGATGAEFESYHNTASAAVSDKVWQHTISAKNASGTKKTAADWYTEWLDATNASEDARTKFRAMVAGTLTEVFGFGSDGFTIGNVTPQGIGTLNVKGGFYIDGVLQTAQTRQSFYTFQSSATQTSVTGAQKITLTSASYNTIAGASWDNTNDELTLPAGTYRFQLSITSFEETGYSGTSAALRFRNTTDSVDVGQSIEIPVISTDRGGGVSCFGDFTIAGSKVFRAEITYSSGTHTWTVRYPQLEVVKVA